MAVTLSWLAAAGAGAGHAKYYFKVGEIKSATETSAAVKEAAQALLEKELAGRPEFTQDIGGVSGPAALEEIKRRKLQGFSVFLKFEQLKDEIKPPRAGGRLKQLAINVKLSVFGMTLPGEKLSFSGEGEAGVEAEVVERRMEEEKLGLTKEAMTQAIRQAVDQAVLKLDTPKSVPMNESKKKHKKK